MIVLLFWTPVALIGRLYASMRNREPHPFFRQGIGVWKVYGKSQRLLVDARPPNCLFDTPPFIHTGGDSISRMQVAPGYDLEVAKADLKNY